MSKQLLVGTVFHTFLDYFYWNDLYWTVLHRHDITEKELLRVYLKIFPVTILFDNLCFFCFNEDSISDYFFGQFNS